MNDFSRRDFLRHSSGSLLAAATMTSDPIMQQSPTPPDERTADAARAVANPGIVGLNLQTAKLGEMRRFYGETFGLRVVAETRESFTIAAGLTRMTFTEASSGQPYYHFAF